MSDDSSFFDSGLLDRMRGGDESAAALVFAKYAEQLARLAEQHLSRRVARRVDGADVVQSVFRSFFQRVERGAFQINSSAQLWKLLVRITLMKAAAVGRWHTTGKRDVRLEDSDSLLLDAATAGGPNADDARNLDEAIGRALEVLPVNQREQYRHLLELKLAGYSNSEVADQLKIARRTVERMLNRLQDSFQHDDSAG